MSAPLRLVFMGTPDFAVPSLRELAKRPDLCTITAVYTQPDRPAGRGKKLTEPPIKTLATELGLPIFQPENINDPDEKRKLSDLVPDVVVVVAYAQFLSQAILNTPRLGCINVHSSLLPKFRGAAPIQYAIWKGEAVTGVTTMKLVKKMDAGPILLQDKVEIGTRTGKELHDHLSLMGGDLIVKTIEGLKNGTVVDLEQDETQVTYAALIKKEDGLIRWEKSGNEILLQIRALDPWPGTFARSTRGTLKILKAKQHTTLPGAPTSLKAGSVFLGGGSLMVKCADSWIELLIVQPEGKRPMNAQEFLNGLRNSPFEFQNEVTL